MVLVNALIAHTITNISNASHLLGIAVLLDIDQNIQIDVKHILLGPNFKPVGRAVGAVTAGGSHGQGDFVLIVVVLHVRTEANEQ